MNRLTAIKITFVIVSAFFVLYITRDFNHLDSTSTQGDFSNLSRRTRIYKSNDKSLQFKDNTSHEQGSSITQNDVITTPVSEETHKGENTSTKAGVYYKTNRKTKDNIFYQVINNTANNESDKSLRANIGHKIIKSDNEYKNENKKEIYEMEEDKEENLCPENRERAILRKLLQKWHSLATRHGIVYYLFFGSLLGYYRNGNILPWDTDVDVAVDVRYFRALRDIASPRTFKKRDRVPRLVIQQDMSFPCSKRTRVSCDGRIVDRSVDGCSFQDPMARIVRGDRHIDIFAMYQMNKNLIHEPTANLSFVTSHIYPLKPCLFLGVKSRCPHKIPLVLQSTYGRGFNIPAKICVDGEWIDQKDVEVVANY